ncbi:MAG: hypothetical protein M3Y23_06735, partial [Actinomycetota bacterium]|nr:hypothetical protein [Actinomycetota bacterium]
MFATGGIAKAAPGDIDRAFGNKGSVTVTVPGSKENVLRDLFALPDGRMLGAGGGAAGEGGFLIRLLPDGSPDPAFGDSGIVRSPDSLWASAAVQSDGKIIAFGRIGKEAAIARFSATGQLDSGFGNQGSVQPSIREDFTYPHEYLEFIKLEVRDDDTFSAAVIPGSCSRDGRPDPDGADWEDPCPNVAVFEFDKDGSLTRELVMAAGISPESGDAAEAIPAMVARGNTGEFVVRSYYPTTDLDGNTNYRSATQKFRADGSPVKEFGDEGLVKGDDVNLNDPGEIHVGDDGRITIVSGSVRRLLANGRPDREFGKRGRVETSWMRFTSKLSHGPNVSDAAFTDEEKL